MHIVVTVVYNWPFENNHSADVNLNEYNIPVLVYYYLCI